MNDPSHYYNVTINNLVNGQIDNYILQNRIPAGHNREEVEQKGKEMADQVFRMTGLLQFFRIPMRPKSVTSNMNYVKEYCIFNMESDYVIHRTAFSSNLILYTLDGHGVIDYCGKRYYQSRGDVFVIDGSKPHTGMANGSKWKYGRVCLNGPSCKEFCRQLEQIGNYSFSDTADRAFQNALYDMLSLYISDGDFTEWEVSASIERLFVTILKNCRVPATDPAVRLSGMQDMIRYIEQHYAEEITLQKLSELSHISISRISHAFKKSTGYSPVQYINYLRIESAKEMLISTNKSINEICYEVGFNSPNSFFRLFRQSVGMTAKAFRSSMVYDTKGTI